MLPVFLGILASLVVLGAGVETFVPGLLSKKLQSDATALTIGILGIVLSILFLMVFLQARIREGFEETAYLTRWNSIVTTNRIGEICTLYLDVFEKIMLVEKGAPPEPLKTDPQAREATERLFTDRMSGPPLSCSLFDDVQSSKENVDTLYLAIQKLPDLFLVQTYETAVACRSLLVTQYSKVQQAEQERDDGFQDILVCTDAAAKERRAFQERKALSNEAATCMLVEDIPPEKKIDAILQKLTRLETALGSYMRTAAVKEPIGNILRDAQYYKNELEKKSKDAQDTSNKYIF